jgi:carbon-monoxide dehydrogenase small subunit
MEITVTINGEKKSADVEPRLLLVHFLRENLRLTGTHVGCDTTNCGACTVLLNGTPVKSCTMFAVQADGHEVTTVEGLTNGPGELGLVQQAFMEGHGLQCGFCTPGFIVSVTALLRDNPNPTHEEIAVGLSGNLCRCTGYQGIFKAVDIASRRIRENGAKP